MRAVLGTSVIVSGLISPHGRPAQLIARWQEADFILLYSPAMLDEFEDVLHRAWLTERLAHVPNRIPDFLEAIALLGEVVVGYHKVTIKVRDPFDEMFLICARLGKANYIVSVDKDLLTLGAYESIPIITPAEFLSVLDATDQTTETK